MNKTIITICERCGNKYEKEIYDLDLEVGDMVRFDWDTKEFKERNGAEHGGFIITKKYEEGEGLYWGTEIKKGLDRCRIDTRNYRYIKVEK